MTETIIKILTDLGIFGIAALIIQKIIENSANKRLEEFKSTLSIIQTKQTSLHQKRLEIIEQLYSKLVELNSSMSILTHPLKQTKQGQSFKEYEKDLTQKASLAYNDFNEFYQKNKIYFNENTNDIIDEILDGFHKAFWDYNQFNFYKETGVQDTEHINEARKNMREAYKSVKDEIPKVRKKLEDEFRDMLNVE